MNNPRLNRFSDQFMTNKREQVEQRCFFLFAGQDLVNGRAFSTEINFTSPDSPDKTKHLQVDIKIDNLTVEQCSDVIVSMTNMIPDFRAVLRYDDLKSKPKYMDIQKVLRRQAPLYYLKTQLIRN